MIIGHYDDYLAAVEAKVVIYPPEFEQVLNAAENIEQSHALMQFFPGKWPSNS